ncbi:MAG: TraB/GumN family protein [Bacteroidia bacterium]
MNKRLSFGLACLLLICTNSLVQAQKKYQGLLWEISGNGASKPSYLYGTMHVSNKLVFNLSDTFYAGLRSADIVALETNPDTWMQDLLGSDLLSGMQNFGYNNYQNNGFYENAFKNNPPTRETLTQIFAEDKQLVNNMLFRTNSASSNYEENTYLDLFIFQAGKKLKKNIINLESFTESMKLYAKAMTPHKDDKKNNVVQFDPNINFDELLQHSYRLGDLDMMDSIMTMINSGKNFRRYFLDERNHTMAKNIDSIIRNKTVFAAVGAAHLAGDEGVINLLRKKGYTVRAVSMKPSKNSIREREKLEKTAFPLTYTSWTSPDEAFKVNVPGKMFEIPEFGNYKQYLFTEMVNSAYFSVIRVETFGMLNGKNQAYLEKSIDSLLYEKVPGKILKREKITSNNGYPGFDIISRTRRGDVLRYKVFISPQEIFVFMMGGNGDFAKKESDKFLTSIQFINNEANKNWKVYKPKHGGYEVKLPGNLIYDDPKQKTTNSFNNETVQAYSAEDSGFYMLMKSSLHDFNYIEEDTFELNQLADNFIAQYDFKEGSRKHNRFNNYPALDIKLKNDIGASLFLKLIIQGPHYYLLAAKNRSGLLPQEFFASFKFTDYTYKTPFVSHIDSTTFSKVLLTEKPSAIADNFANMRNNFAIYTNGTEDNSYQYDSREKTYYSKATAESVLIKYSRFHKFVNYENLDELFEIYTNDLVNENKMIIRSQKRSTIDNMPILDIVLTDTGSTRAIKTRMILKEGAIYTIKRVSDTLTKDSEWLSQFFNSFRPADTTIGESVFVDKTQTFLSALKGTDSTLKKQALNSLYIIELNEKNAPAVMDYIKSSDYQKQELENRAQIIRLLGRTKNQQNIPFLKDLYAKVTDTVTLQLAVLEALASQKNLASTQAVLELLKKETPLTSEEYTIGRVFYPFYDSLLLARHLYPALLSFSSYPEYKNNVYDLLARLVDSGIVNKSIYAASKTQILKEANEELKRQFANEEKMQKQDYSDYENDAAFDYGNENYSNSKILSYTTLLTPFYNESPVKTYFDKLARLQDKQLKLDVSVLMLRKNIPVADTIWKSFATDLKWRIPAYNSLKDINKLQKFDTTYSNQLDIAKAGLYSYSFNLDKDSLEYLGKKEVRNKDGNALLYFFKSKKENDQNWQFDYIAYRNLEPGKITTELSLSRHKKMLLIKNEDVEKAIKDAVKDATTIGRKRVTRNDDYYAVPELDYYGE